jgi:hypothetical protein
MAGRKNVFGICDTCGFRYKLNQLKKNSYGMMVCPTDYDGQYDLKNHPQNRSPRIDERYYIKDARPEYNGDRNAEWQNVATQWENETRYWNLI